MKKVILFVFFKNNPQPFKVVLTEAEALQFIKNWREKRPGHMSGHVREEDLHWSVDPAEVACMYCQDLERIKQIAAEQQRQQQMQGQAPSSWWNPPAGSGNN